MIKKIISILLSCYFSLTLTCFANTEYEKSIKLGDNALDNQQYEQALKHYNKAIEMEPKNPAAYINRSITYAFQNEDKKAIKDLNKAIKFNRHNQFAYNNRALEYLKLEQYHKAIKDFSKAIILNPKEPNYYANRGLCYFHISKEKLSQNDLNKALELDKNNEIAMMHVARIHELKHNYNKAAKIFSYIAVKFDNGDAEQYAKRCIQKQELKDFGYPEIWIDYVYETETKIKSNWNPPVSKKSYLIIAEIIVTPKGEIIDYTIIKSSKNPKYDDAVKEAIENSKSLFPIPQVLKKRNCTLIIPFQYKYTKKTKTNPK